MKKKMMACVLIIAMLIAMFSMPIHASASSPFSDIKDSDWFSEAVNFVVSRGLMNGTGESKFDPNGTMTRAMLVTVLWRAEGEPAAAPATFSDVASGRWYSNAVAWASENQVVNGVGDNRFNPNGNITREQMATILYRFAAMKEIDTSERADLSIYPDGNKVSKFAKDAISWAVGVGLINGMDGKIAPQGNATRAQVATILMRYIVGVTEVKIRNVALITDVGRIDDQSFNQACWEGVAAWCSANDVNYTYYQPSEPTMESQVMAAEIAIYEGADVLVLPGYMFGPVLLELQDRYPDVYFIAADVTAGDMTYDYLEYYDPSINAACLTFAEEQAGYLAGYAAVRDGYTKLGFLGGIAVPLISRYGYGFIQGADAAAAELGVDIEINYTYGGVFFGTPEITAKMEGWYAAGTEVVFACGGGIYTSVVEAANKYNGKVIGVDIDQSWLDDCFITSAMKNLKNCVERMLSELAAGNWAKYGGKFKNLTLADGDFVGLPTGEDSWRFEKFTVQELEQIKSEIANGTRAVSDDVEELPKVSSHTNLINFD